MPLKPNENYNPEKKQYHYHCHNCGKKSEETRDEPFPGSVIFCPTCKTKKKDDPPKRGATTQELQEVLCHEFGLPGNLTFKQAMRFIKDELANLKKELAAEKEDHVHTIETSSDTFSRGLDLIVAERLRQIEEEGWKDFHDDQHDMFEMLEAAICYIDNVLPDVDKTMKKWPWDQEWDKREKHDQFKSLAIAGALIAAEIDRLFRLKEYEDREKEIYGKEGGGVDLYPKWPNGTLVTQEEFDQLRKNFIFEFTSRDGSEDYNIHELCKKDPDERVKVASGSEQTMVTNDYQASPHATPLEKAMEMHERHKNELRSNIQPYSPLVHTLDHIFEYLKTKDHEMKVCIPDCVTSVTKGEE